MKKFDANESLNYETTRKDLIEKSNKRAWIVAGISLFITCLLAIAIILMLPLKTIELRVVKVDNNGFVDVITELNSKTITTSEAVDKHFVQKYVKVREQYYYNTISKDYEETQMLSNNLVQSEYLSFMNNKKDGRIETYANKKEMDVNIISIVLGDSNGTKTATVRAELIEKDLQSKTTTTYIKVFSMTYEYLPQIKQNESSRLNNPLGFLITFYKSDNEILKSEQK